MADPVLALRGEIDSSNAPRLRHDLRTAAREHRSPLVVDCGHLTFIDLAGIETLENVRSELERRGTTVRLENLSPFHAHLIALYESMPGRSPAEPVQLLSSRRRTRLTTTATTVTR
jgi:anti-anti-sigma factor